MSTGPTIAEPAGMVGQFYDGEAVSLASTDWVPTVAGKNFARAVQIGGTGGTAVTLKVDFLGIGGAGGATGVTMNVVAGELLQIAVVKIYKTGTTATGITALY